jgi:hypothetical protein
VLLSQQSSFSKKAQNEKKQKKNKKKQKKKFENLFLIPISFSEYNVITTLLETTIYP